MPLPAHYVSNRAVIVGGGKKRIDCSAIVHDSFVAPATSTVLTLNAKIGAAGLVMKEIVDGAVVATGTVVAATGVYTPAAAPNGAHNYDIWYISDFPEESSY